MMKHLHENTGFHIFCAYNCFECLFKSEKQSDIVGKWNLVKVNKNDSWGGPFYWTTANYTTKIEFTRSGQYLRKELTDSDFKLIGDYKRITDSSLHISYATPPN